MWAGTTPNPGSDHLKSRLKLLKIWVQTTQDLGWDHSKSVLEPPPAWHCPIPPYQDPNIPHSPYSTLLPPNSHPSPPMLPPRGDTGALTKGQRCRGDQSRWHTDLLITLGCWCPWYPPGARGTGRAGLGGAKRCHLHPPSVHRVGGNGSK